ncbi:MAG: SUMF1/EgtB/PvdO family nonheme iron enzyme [Chitinophagaceae bacterium]
MKTLLSTIAFLFLLDIGSAWGNGITLTNLTSVSGAGYVQLQFDLTWSNSWNNSINHDAAWVFFKFKDNDGTWHHLHLTNSNNSIAASATMTVPPDLTGVMIYRSTAGTGTLTLTSVQVGVENLPGNFDVKGFALEMVQIPVQDQYYLGDGEAGTYYSNNLGTAFLVNANSISLGFGAGLLDDGIASTSANLAIGFPTAYNTLGAFQSLYMMKHEISQAAYRDFLNTLTYTQQATRTGTAPSNSASTMALTGAFLSRRNTIQIQTSGVASATPAVYGCNLNNNSTFNETSDGEWIACNYLTYMDVAAFLDWAALRPMTEMEFEKSCRGTKPALAAENAAGVDSAYGNQPGNVPYPLSNPGSATESVTAYSGSVLFANITYSATSTNSSPTRVGIHATANSTRISAGAGYYGALDLSGNIEEYTVTSANAAGRSFTGANGDGQLTPAGDADEDFWPGINNNSTNTVANTVFGGVTGVTGQGGVIVRGGSASQTGFNYNKVSYRINPTGVQPYARSGTSGGRGVKNW